MARITTLTYDLANPDATVNISNATPPLNINKVSYQLTGDAAVNGTVTVKLQESNTPELTSGNLDITGATAIANVSSDEYVGIFEFGGAYLMFVITKGTATAGIVTLTLNYK